ncbi:DNA phosphorothioation-dependent restriction protein DptG [Vibrio sp. E14]|uniref:DNA phosphorothioation-dependent restriction protein DptG n=1 Tax=Vibrio sp. E14 TaxID=2849869 RepID=UPI001CF87AB7|nr:DNA phosphorothioation-dependent restriction protein DptG [Vibrio sp. E14]
MFPIPDNFIPADINRLKSYWPIRNKGNDYKWENVTELVLGQALNKQVSQLSLEQYRDKCQQHFVNILDNSEFWTVLDKTYFTNESLFKISPLFLLFKVNYSEDGKLKVSVADSRMSTLFFGLMDNYKISEALNHQLNFVEKELLEVLFDHLTDKKSLEVDELPYLPFLNQTFQADMNFLAIYPQYLLTQLANLLKLYAFSYCSQLVMNVDKFKKGEPESAKIYFILDSEKASSERSALKNFGYKTLKLTSERVFPLLSALEQMQIKGQIKRPLWKVYQDVQNYADPQKVLDKFNEYLATFAELRRLAPRPEAQGLEQAFDIWRELAIEQFKDIKSERSGVNNKYVNQLESQIFAEFVQSRGPAGKTLVLNQDQLILLTNLAIGQRERLRLHELIKEFESRGFYLDNQSQQALIEFFERMGNVERMSDSGDAVYVRKTL